MTLEEFRTLKIGDVVKLNSGSSRMVVNEIENNFISCFTWSESQDKIVVAANNIDYALFNKISD